MSKLIKHIRCLILFCVGMMAVSCDKTIDHTHPVCDYTVQLRYDYNIENSTATNEYPRYVRSAEEYIFDAGGTLILISPVTQDICTGAWVSELDLPPGSYSVIAVGNRSGMSLTTDDGKPVREGFTKREDMLLTLTNRSVNDMDDGTNFLNTGRLYHGYRTFTVKADEISRVRVDMVHSHLDLRFTIRWKGNAVPANTNDFYVLLSDVPSQYSLMPEFIYPEPKAACQTHDPASDSHDPYNSQCLAVRHHIVTVQKASNVISHRNDVYLSGNVISGQMLSYRLRNPGSECTETKISLWHGRPTRADTKTAGGSSQDEAGTNDLSPEPVRMMKDIHINDFLVRSFEDLDATLKQQYHIIFEINPVTGEVDVWMADIADWDEGGNLGG